MEAEGLELSGRLEQLAHRLAGDGFDAGEGQNLDARASSWQRLADLSLMIFYRLNVASIDRLYRWKSKKGLDAIDVYPDPLLFPLYVPEAHMFQPREDLEVFRGDHGSDEAEYKTSIGATVLKFEIEEVRAV